MRSRDTLAMMLAAAMLNAKESPCSVVTHSARRVMHDGYDVAHMVI